jgi:RNA polymerase sigma-70 factor (ECF subfamily)
VQSPEQGDEDVARLFRHVRRLPAEQRQVIMGRFVKEKSIRDVARELQKSEGAVKQLQNRALETLRERMGENDA